jgi:starch synthase
MINRMDHQKGVDLVPDALRSLESSHWQAVILGTGDPALEAAAADLDREVPRVRTVLRYDGALARRMYAGADLMIIPSRYEPCGLTQMIAMRYGCVPAARATGGLKDTIGDYHAAPRSESTGLLFQEASSVALADTLQRALEIYRDQRRWKGLQRRGMKQDFSWARSAVKYQELYEELIRDRQSSP